MIMWSRIDLKNKAKETLRGTYVNGLIVSFLMMLASGAWARGSDDGNNVDVNMEADLSAGMDGFSEMMEGPKAVFETIGAPTLISMIVGFVTFIVVVGIIKVLVGYLIEVGGQKYFLETSKGDSVLNNLTYGFTSGKWLNIVRTMFLRSVFTYLWALLFIIPGIIKYYSYRMVPYLLAENPDLDSFEAIERSKEMTSGQKMDMFIMDLSFIGWFILGALLFGVGTVLVMPYYNATYAELYYTLKGEDDYLTYEG